MLLRVGFIIDGKALSVFEHWLITQILKRKDLFASPVLVINTAKTPGKMTFFARWLYRLIYSFEVLRLRRKTEYKNFGYKFPARELQLNTHSVKPTCYGNKKCLQRLNESDLLQIKGLNLDVLVHLGSGILRGDILNITRFGVLGIHPGNNRFYRGSPAGFWEIYDKNAESGFIIQQLTETLDAGHVLHREVLPTQNSWVLNKVKIQEKAYPALLQVLYDLALSETLPSSEEDKKYSKEIRKHPKLRQLIQYIFD